MMTEDEILNRVWAMSMHPKMFAITKEAFVSQIAILLDVLGCDGARTLYLKHLCQGSAAVHAKDDFDNKWAAEVIMDFHLMAGTI